MSEFEQGKTGLATVEFSDLYLEPDGQAWTKRSSGDHERNALPDSIIEEALNLRQQLQAHRTGLDFRTEWNGMELRVTRIESLDGDVFCCRHLLKEPMPIWDTGYPGALIDAILSEAFSKGGLFLVTGATGAGKTVLLTSWLTARLKKYGGTALTVENPIEIRWQGRHGSGNTVGTCYQTEVRDDNEFGVAMQRMLRASPNMIMLGEIRTNEAATQAVWGGMSGHLVGSTLHADSVQSSLETMKNKVQKAGLDHAYFAEALAGIIHLEKSQVWLGGEYRKTTTISPLLVAGSRNATSIRVHLRSGDYSQLASEIERQRRILTLPKTEQAY